MDVCGRSGFALFLWSGTAHSAATTFRLYKWIITRTSASEFPPFLRPDLYGDTREAQAQEADTKENSEQCCRHDDTKVMCALYDERQFYMVLDRAGSRPK